MNILIGIIWGLIFYWIASPDPQAWMFAFISGQVYVVGANVLDAFHVIHKNQKSIYDKIK